MFTPAHSLRRVLFSCLPLLLGTACSVGGGGAGGAGGGGGAFAPGGFDEPVIGANMNGMPRLIADHPALLDHSGTTWVRAFIDVRKKMQNGLHPKDDPDVAGLRTAADRGRRLIVNFKWDFKASWGDKEPMRMPPANSEAERELFRAATRHLRNIGSQVDIVVLGNEPMWETLPADIEGENPHLIGFTRRLKDHLIEHGDHGPSLYLVGAFNQMGPNVAPRFQPFVNGMLRWARNDDDIAGVDVHTHFDRLGKARSMLRAARNQVGNKMVLDTEFSPIWRYHRNVRKTIGSWPAGRAFADNYGVPHGWTVAEYLQDAKADLISRREYADFMDAMPWYRADHLRRMYSLFQEFDVAFGGVGFFQNPGLRRSDWTRDGWQPFHINFLYQPAVVKQTSGISATTVHPRYMDDYRRYAGGDVGIGDVAGVEEGGMHRLVSVKSGHCLDVGGGSREPGGNVQQWSCNGKNPQAWRVSRRDDGFFTLESAHSGLCLDVAGHSSDPGTNVQQWSCNGGAAQAWRIVPLGGGYYSLAAQNSELCLDVAKGSDEAGANVQQWMCNSAAAQIWRLE